MPYQSFPFNAPRTWREFFARVAAIALAGLLVLGVMALAGLRGGASRPVPYTPADPHVGARSSPLDLPHDSDAPLAPDAPATPERTR